MLAKYPILFDRVFPPREWFRGRALRVVLWSSLGAALLCILLLAGSLIVAVVTDRGEARVAFDDLPHYATLTNDAQRPGGEPPVQLEDLDDAVRAVKVTDRVDQGLRATVWLTRQRHWSLPLAAMCRGVPALRHNGSALVLLVMTAAMIALARSLVVSRTRTLGERVALEAATRLRRSLHRQTLRVGPSSLEDAGDQYSQRLFTIETESVRKGVFGWASVSFRHVLTLLLLLVLVLVVDWLLALECLIPLLACWYLVLRTQQQFDGTRGVAEESVDRELRLLGEGLRKTRLVRGYGMDAFEHERFQVHLDRFLERTAALGRGESWSWWVTRLLALLCLTITVFLVGMRSLPVSGNPPTLPFFAGSLLLAAFAAMYHSLEELRRLSADLTVAERSAGSIADYLKLIPEVGQAVGAKFLQPLSKSLQFEAVCYDLPTGVRLLDQFDLRLPGKCTAAFVSLEPLEARAVAYLLPRFIEPQSGRVLLDGEDIAWVTLESLRAEAIYVGGADPFFTGTVFENISCGNPDYKLPDVTDAAKETHAHNFILKLPQGYETFLGEHGEQLDTGRGFRLGLARAVVRNPALLIVDEPAGTLDDDTKSLLDDAYGRISRDRTLVFLPTRLSTVRRADTIVVIHRGKVAAIGDYARLIKSSAMFRHWEYVRFNEFRGD